MCFNPSIKEFPRRFTPSDYALGPPFGLSDHLSRAFTRSEDSGLRLTAMWNGRISSVKEINSSSTKAVTVQTNSKLLITKVKSNCQNVDDAHAAAANK